MVRAVCTIMTWQNLHKYICAHVGKSTITFGGVHYLKLWVKFAQFDALSRIIIIQEAVECSKEKERAREEGELQNPVDKWSSLNNI